MTQSRRSGPQAAWWHWWLPGALALLALLTGYSPVQRLDLLAFDLISSIAPAAPHTSPAVVIAIDERSLQQLGRWPWSRAIHARLLDRLSAAPPSVVAFAILFDQPDADDPGGDLAFAAAIARSGRVLLAVAPVAANGTGGLRAALPTGVLAGAGAALGHADVELDADGRLRRLYLQAGIGATPWPALALTPAAAMPPRPLPGRRSNITSAADPARWQRDHEVLLQLDRGQGIEQFSYADVLTDAALAASLAGRVAFVGVTAAGISSSFSTALEHNGGLIPAVEFHARAHEALRAGDLVTPLEPRAVIVLSLLAIGAGALSHRRYRRVSPAVETLVIGAPVLLSCGLLVLAQLWFPPLAATLALTLGYLLWAAMRLRVTRGDLLLARRHAEVTLDAVADGVVSVDRDGHIEFANPVAQAMLGADAAALEGKHICSLPGVTSATRQSVQDGLARCFALSETIHVAEPVRLGHPDGCVVRVVIGPIFGTARKLEGAVMAFSDISEAIAAGERLRHQATHDALTDLPNRLLMSDRIRQSLAAVQRNDSSIGVMFVDLDDFKRINDSFGHAVGDRVLCALGSRLKAACRGADSVGRWGGDEFVVLLSDLSSPDAIELVARKLLAAVAEPILIDAMAFHLTATIGISRGPQDSRDADELLGMADTAMYRVKQQGGGNFGFSSAEMSAFSRQRMDIESGLREALRNDELVVFYQPQIRIGSGTLAGFEALIRWNRPGHGLLLPNSFIPVAEESDLIVKIGAWVLDQVAQQLRQWLDEGLSLVPVAINVSARQCLGEGLVKAVSASIERYGIPPRLIELEITETTAMADAEHVATLLEQLNTIGVRVALDDFGTGYSSLSHLRRFPLSVLKIDQSFVRGAIENADDAAIARATIALAHNLGLTVVGEGVESETQRDFLAMQACDIGQGYLYGRPDTAAAMRELLVSGAVRPQPAPALPAN